MHTTATGAPAPTAQHQYEGLATTAEAQKFLCLSRTTIYYLTLRGVLRPVRIGRAQRFRWADLRQFVEQGGLK